MVDGILYSKVHNYAILYSSKSACSSIRYFFLELHGNEVDTKLKKWYEKKDISEKFFPLPKEININSIPKFLVVRNPYLRVVSMYTNKFIGENSLLKQRFLKKNVHYENNSFLSFLKAIKSVKDREKNKTKSSEALKVVSTHITEQSYKITNGYIDLKNVKVVDVNDLEAGIYNFYSQHFPKSELLSNVKKILLKDNNCLHSNKTERTSLYANKDVSNIEFKDLSNIPPYQSFYINPKIKELVDEIYDQDFKIFKYKKVLPF